MPNSTSTANTVLITGGAQRLGKRIALYFAARGWHIALHYHHSEDAAAQTQAEIQQMGVQCAIFRADLNDAEQCQQLFADALQHFPRMDALVNNAALFEYDDAPNFSPDVLQQHLGVNLVAPLLLSQQLYQHLQTRPTDQGVVINLLDQKLWGYNPDFFSYTLCKAALKAATTMMAQGLAPLLRVAGVAPGLTLASHLQSAEDFARTHALSPLGRSSTAEDVASTVYHIATTRSITGTCFVVDGGQHLLGLQRDVSML